MTKKRSGSRHSLDDTSPRTSRSPVLRINTNLRSPAAAAAVDGSNAAMPPPLVLTAATATATTATSANAPTSAVPSPLTRRTSTNSPRLQFPKQLPGRALGGVLARSGSFSSGTSSVASSPLALNSNATASPSPSPYPIRVAMLSKNMRTRVDFRATKGEVLSLGEFYLNDLSDLRVFEVTNVKARRVQLQLKLELRKPFQTSAWGFQLENENLELIDASPRDVGAMPHDEFNHVPFSVLRASSRAALCAENVYLCEGYNELFNHIGTVETLVLEPHETRRVVFALCAKLSASAGTTSNSGGHATGAAYALNDDSSEEERLHLSQTSCAVLTGRLVMKLRYVDAVLPATPATAQLEPSRASAAGPDLVLPLQGHVCRSLLRLDVKELHFDDCVPGGSFVKDFTVWNRSEIPLLFKLVSSLAAFDDTKDLITCTDYNSGYVVGDKTLQAAAYGHVRIRVTYRPDEIGERFFEIQAQNLHDSRNVKILKIHAITNKEHHREGLSIKEPSGSYLMSGSKLDFGDCYTGIANSKVLLIRNTTEATLHVDLTSDRPKEISFELKLQQNRARAARASRTDDVLSPTGSNDGSSRKGSLSPDAAKAVMAFASADAISNYGLDSDEEAEENEMDFFDDDFLPPKRSSFDENPLGDLDDLDDDFEFDREPLRVAAQSPSVSPKSRVGGRHASETRKKAFRTKGKKSAKVPSSRVRDLAYESGVDSSGNSICSSPERKPRADYQRKRQTLSIDDAASGSNFLVETIDLPPGVERTILIWYTPATMASSSETFGTEPLDNVDLKGARLTKQTFRVSFRCFQIQGSAWQQAQSRVYDRTLGKSIHIRARTCTSIVTVSPSVLHLGDCNIGELKSSSCMLTNHSELPTVVKPLVTSKVISTVPNDDLTLGPKQSTELKIEIIPRKTNPNYSRLISVLNLRNRANIPQICVRSSNMDAHHVIYHSLFYKLVTPTRSAFLNFDHVALNAVGIQVFDLENITNAPLHLSLQSSDATKVRLYCFRTTFSGKTEGSNSSSSGKGPARAGSALLLQSAGDKQHSATSGAGFAAAAHARTPGKVIRRRRSFGSLSEIANAPASSSSKRNMSSVLRGYLSKKLLANGAAQSSAGGSGASSAAVATSLQSSPLEPAKLRNEQLASSSGHHHHHHHHLQASAPGTPLYHVDATAASSSNTGMAFGLASATSTSSAAAKQPAAEELAALLHLFDTSRTECEQYCHSTVLPSPEKEHEIVAMVRERMRKLQSLLADKKLLPLALGKDRNVRIPAKSQQRVVAIFSPSADYATAAHASETASKVRVEKQKIFITLPAGGNKKAVADAARFDQSKATWVTAKHPFDSRPSVRELLLKSRVCRSVLNVNQKNINFGRIATSAKSSKRLVVQNMSPIPLVYSVEKTGSISSGFLEIKEGDVGVVKAFGTKEICFEFQPTLAGPFEEKLRIVNVQDVENSISVTIKAKVVKRETFKLLQSGQVLSLGKCLVGEQSDEIKIAVRNTSRKKRDYMIQLDPSFSNPGLKPTFYFSVDETPSAIITQAQEKKLDEELEKLEHKLRIATTKKKSDKITKLNAKIARAKALLSGEQVPVEKKKKKRDEDAAATDTDDAKSATSPLSLIDTVDDSCNSESEMSESESTPRALRRRPTLQLAKSLSLSDTRGHVNQLHFTLDAEATCRIVASAVFTATPAASAVKGCELLAAGRLSSFKSQKARKRQLRRDSTPIIGVGKFLLYEQQNKDIMKELQYSAECFLRTDAGEAAYSRAVGRSVPPSQLALSETTGGSALTSMSATAGSDVRDASSDTHAKSNSTEPVLSLQALLAKSDSSRGLSVAIPDSDRAIEPASNVLVRVEPNQFAIAHSSTLLIPLEESPADTFGWDVTLTHQSPALKRVSDVQVAWRPCDALERLLRLNCEVTPTDAVIVTDAALELDDNTSDDRIARTNGLPVTVRLAGDRAVTLRFKWCFARESGFAASNSLASCISRSVLAKIARALEQSAGRLEFVVRSSASPTSLSSASTNSAAPFATVSVAVVKAVQRSLCVDSDRLELGEQQQGTEVHGEFIIRNRSHRQVKYLLLMPSAREQSSSSAASVSASNGSAASTSSSASSSTSSATTSTSSGGDLVFDKPTGSIAANSHVIARFTYRGTTPGQHSEQIELRNLNDRLDTSVVTLAVRVTRPVYVRVPELDPLATGQLDVLDLGPCYVSPEMQDAAVDSPNASLKFSKVHKLTLHNQVAEALVLCASSNLKTQCYVFEDSRLTREATHVVLRGEQSIDLYAAFRPRLSSDAFKTGSTRDLVGGIRVQLFRLLTSSGSAATATAAATGSATSDTTDVEKSEMVAEFTIKFVGVAGASLARVTPAAIDFGVERNLGGRATARAHAGRFELINVSKALPLRYRLFVASDRESYADDDRAVRVALEHEHGTVPAGESKSVAFTLTAFASGLFRRRILVENVNYPGRVSTVDVQLVVDSGALKCEVFGSSIVSMRDDSSSSSSSAVIVAPAAATPPSALHVNAIDFGVVNVITLEDELADASSTAGATASTNDNDSATATTMRKYRIFETRHVESPAGTGSSSSATTVLKRKPLARERFLTLTNTTNAEMVLRPVSTLPLTFVWCSCGKIPPLAHECEHRAVLRTAQAVSLASVRRLHVDAADGGVQAIATTTTTTQQLPSVYVGDTHRLAPQSSCTLFVRFAPISLTAALPSELIEAGKLVPFSGVVAIQRFDEATADVEADADAEAVNSTDDNVASTLKVVKVSGEYAESRMQVAERHVSLGKIGYAIGWKASRFELAVANTSDVAVCFALARLPLCIRIRDVRGATPTAIASDVAFTATATATAGSNSSYAIPSLRELVLHTERRSVESDADSPRLTWKIDARSTCVMEMEFFRTAESLSAGVHDFALRLLNLSNPHNVEDVVVRAHIISSYAEVTVDPESSSVGAADADAARSQLQLPRHVAFLPPVVVPPAQDASPQGANFWFSLRNVYDEELNVKLSSTPHSALESTLEFLLFSRSSNTPVSTLQIAPGDSIDVRVVCHVFSSARLSPETLESTDLDPTYDSLELGSVWLDVSVPSASEPAQTKHIQVKGKLVPGRTFTLSASSLHFFAGATEIPADIPLELLPLSLRSKTGSSRESVQLALAGAAQSGSSTAHHLRNTSETFYVRNPSALQPLNFMIESVAMYQPGLCLLKGAAVSEMSAMSEYIEAVAVPSSGTVAPGDSMKITVRLEEATLVAAAESAHYHGSGDNAKAASLLHKMRHHPSWRSNSWGAEPPDDAVADAAAQNHMFLKVRDVDMSADMGVSTDVDVHLVLQQTASSALSTADGGSSGTVGGSSTSSSAKSGSNSVDVELIRAAFAAREKRLVASKKAFTAPTLATHVEDSDHDDSEYGGVDNLDEFDVDSISTTPSDRRSQLPVLTVRGCTPAENSMLESTRYIVDAGQHTVRNGGEVEWEITVECLYTQLAAPDSTGGVLEPVEYKLLLVDRNAKSWLQLSRDRGTLDRSRSYQSVVLYFLRDVVGVYSTFMVLQNVTNPSDLKVIHVRLEVIADLNMLRSMSSGADPTTNLFRVLVSNHGTPKRQRRSSLEFAHGGNGGGSSTSGGGGTGASGVDCESPRSSSGTGSAAARAGLVIDYSEVYYHKLYHNHSIVLENASGLALDFMLSSNARPQEVSFSTSPMSFTEVSAVTLEAYGRMQVFLHFRPQPRPITAPTPTGASASAGTGTSAGATDASGGVEHWNREIEVYINCRLVKDFRETVILRAICHPPQLQVHVAATKTDEILSTREAPGFFVGHQPSFLGAVFSMPEAALSSSPDTATPATASTATAAASDVDQFIVVHNTRSDVKARLALRNDSMFFTIGVDVLLTVPGSVDVHYLDNGICAGRRSTLLVTIQPRAAVVFRVTPDVASLWKHHQLWDHSVKEHVTLYNIKQFAEHYQVTLCFTCSSTASSFYIPPNVSESYPFSALEDTIAKFLQNYNYTWRGLVSYHEAQGSAAETSSGSKSSSSSTTALSAPKLVEILSDLESALELSSPLSPRKLHPVAPPDFASSPRRSTDGFSSGEQRDVLHQLLQSYRALYFDFYYITDELVWYGVRGNAVRHSLMLADLAYGVVFNHDVFRAFLAAATDATSSTSSSSVAAALDSSVFPRLLLPWIRQLGHFLSFFPESQDTTMPLRQLYDQLRKFEVN